MYEEPDTVEDLEEVEVVEVDEEVGPGGRTLVGVFTILALLLLVGLMIGSCKRHTVVVGPAVAPYAAPVIAAPAPVYVAPAPVVVPLYHAPYSATVVRRTTIIRRR